MPHRDALRQQLGSIDVYLFDQLLKGHLDGARHLLDVGCGKGRNLTYFLRSGLDVHGIDSDPAAIDGVRQLARKLAPALPADNFRVATSDDIPHDDGVFDFVMACAVMHFADSEHHFRRMLDEMWRVLAPGGLFFARLASTTGLPNAPAAGLRIVMADGVERFLVDEPMLERETVRVGGELHEPIRTTVVRHGRSMATWCLRK